MRAMSEAVAGKRRKASSNLPAHSMNDQRRIASGIPSYESCLRSGVPVADVAELIGDTEEVVKAKHYARWVPERQARLTRILQEALGKPKLAVIGGRK